MATEKATMFVTNCAQQYEDMEPIKAHEYVDEVLSAPCGVYSTLEKAKAAILDDVKAEWLEFTEQDYNGELEWRKIKRLDKSNKLWCYEATTNGETDDGDFSIVARIYEIQID